jgi:hypothetical protein
VYLQVPGFLVSSGTILVLIFSSYVVTRTQVAIPITKKARKIGRVPKLYKHKQHLFFFLAPQRPNIPMTSKAAPNIIIAIAVFLFHVQLVKSQKVLASVAD